MKKIMTDGVSLEAEQMKQKENMIKSKNPL